MRESEMAEDMIEKLRITRNRNLQFRMVLLDTARQLETWALESREGGWSTHQSGPQEALSNRLRRYATGAEAMPTPSDEVAEAALNRIACWDDDVANNQLRINGSYAGFDEPSSVKIAREALASIKDKAHG
jgi:hypothetical protein